MSRSAKSKKDKSSKKKDKARTLDPPRTLPTSAAAVSSGPIIVGPTVNGAASGSSATPVEAHTSTFSGDDRHNTPEPTTDASQRKRHRLAHEDEPEDDPEKRRRHRKLRKILEAMASDVRTGLATDSISNYHMQIRQCGRVISPFLRSHEALVYGKSHALEDISAESDSDAESEDEDIDSNHEDEELKERKQWANPADHSVKFTSRELKYQYSALLNIILPSPKSLIEGLQIDYTVRATRGDDTGSLKERVIKYMSAMSGLHDEYQKAPGVIEKSHRGWYNWYTARFLCPQEMLVDFDHNWEEFAERILRTDEDALQITAGDLPSFLYDAALADWNDDEAGLMQGPLLLTAYKSLLTGPSSALLPSGRQDRAPGRPPLASLYKITRAHPRTIAYVATLVRFCLNSATGWSVMDYDFNAYEFHSCITNEIFGDPHGKFYKETLAWWDQKVFAYAMDKQRPKTGRETAADRIARKRAEERKAAKTARRTAAALAANGTDEEEQA
ncbi:hypothetical protein BV20DRAFT_982988 [Pilatotrama ljubarskyi]|nr:hypothetical protein BV20DRAFT_982988 [Pilatotrama ljubarskyi]